jgi:hypothetical protein
MTDEERWSNVCGPKLSDIETKVDKLITVVVEGNGKRSLVQRVNQLEDHAANPPPVMQAAPPKPTWVEEIVSIKTAIVAILVGASTLANAIQGHYKTITQEAVQFALQEQQAKVDRALMERENVVNQKPAAIMKIPREVSQDERSNRQAAGGGAGLQGTHEPVHRLD